MSSEVENRPLRFTGTAAEYFRIWIVNLCLSVLTLGLYTPWAKVRTRQYFYGHLQLAGSSFWYDADPMRVLVGRLIVVGYFGAVALSDEFLPVLSGVLGAAALFLFPWMVVRSTAFHHRHSLYRNVRFGFSGRYGEAAAVFIGWPLLVGLTGGLLYPWWRGRRQQFLARNSRFGGTGFEFNWKTGGYYDVYTWAAVVIFLVALSIGIFAFAYRTVFSGDSTPAASDTYGAEDVAVVDGLAYVADGLPGLRVIDVSNPAVPVGLDVPEAGDESGGSSFGMVDFVFLAVILLGFAVFGAVAAIVQAGLTNLLYRQAALGGFRFRSDLRAGRLVWIYLTSGLAVAATVGLALPWTRVRMARYRAEHLELVGGGDLDAFVKASEQEGRQLGELASEVADAFDFDIGF